MTTANAKKLVEEYTVAVNRASVINQKYNHLLYSLPQSTQEAVDAAEAEAGVQNYKLELLQKQLIRALTTP